MQKVISINLNGNAYQLDESGYETLREYLARADHELRGNPDRAEILADLEQAIADKCQRYLGAHKNVLTTSEIERIVAEMGPVDTAAGEQAEAGAKAGTSDKDAPKVPPRRVYRIMDGAMIAGVCNGLAAHLQIDVTVMRIAFVVAALITKGVGIIGYIVLMFVIPEARTPEARSAAAGVPLNAKDVIERAKKQYADGTRHWRRQWRKHRRQWQRRHWTHGMPIAYGPPIWVGVTLPLFGLVHLALFLTVAAMTISLVNTGTILNWELPPDVPVWAGVLILLIAYQIAVSPLRAIQQWASFPGPGAEPGMVAFWNAVVWLAGLAFAIWIASNHMPEIREFLQHLPELFREFIESIRQLTEER